MSDAPKTFLVTGANKGLGLAIVKTLLANQPDATVLATVRAVAAAEGLFALREPLGGRLEVVEMDVEDEASVKTAAEEVAALPVVQKHGLGMLILSASISHGLHDTTTEMKLADLKENLKVNLEGAVNCARYFLPLVRASQAKRIVYISSGAGSTGLGFSIARPGDVASYGVSRAAANHYFARLARQLEGEGVRVTIYSPGFVDTPQTAGVVLESRPKLTADQAADLWYANHLIGAPKSTGTFFDEHGKTLPW